MEGLAAGESFHTIRVPAHRMPTARIRARILDPEGRVPEAARLSICALTLGLPQSGSVPADDRGYAESGFLPPGTYRLTIRSRDHFSIPLGEKVLHQGEALDLGQIRVGG